MGVQNDDNANPIGRHLDLTDIEADPTSGRSGRGAGDGRTWIGIYYECCSAYARVYRRPDQPAYRGQCPECGAAVSVRVGPNGVAARMLVATPI